MNKHKKLAIHGGEKTIRKTIDRYNLVGNEFDTRYYEL